MPSVLTGSSLIQTANDDKKSTTTTALSFDISQTATIYVAYDPRATTLPSWLSTWQKLTDKLGINDSKISTMDLYSKSYAAGTVRLGGNWAGTAVGAENNYFVVVKGEGTSTPQFSLTVSTSGSGSVTKNPNQTSYASGTSVSLTATPTSGNQFTGWSGDASGTSNPLSVTMNSSKTIIANFAPTQSSTSLITNITSTTGRSYTQATLVAGANLYTDRTYQLTGVPASLNGEVFIQTPNDDKKITSTSVISFSLSQNATVYVGYDPRATAIPTWLSSWQKLSDKLNINDPGTSTLDLYSKSYPAGTVTLGGNLASPAAGTQTNYVVAVKQATTTSNSLSFSPTTLNFNVVKGSSVSSQSIVLSASTGAPSVTLSKSSASWLTLPAASLGTLTFGASNINSNINAGTYQATVTASATNYQPATMQINLTVTEAGSAQEIKVNFQAGTTNTPSGYLADTGQPFETGRGYGWVDPSTKQPKDLSSSMRVRSTTDEFRLRTLAQMQAPTPGSWEYVLPNGSYNVSVSVGDPSYTDSNHAINVEGVSAISNFKPSSSQKFQSATVPVEVRDGKLTIDAAGGTNTKLNYVIISSTTPGADITPPVVNVSFAGTQVSPNTFKDEAQVSVNASDAGGSGLASVQYSLNNGPYTNYTAPFKVTTLGNHTIRAKALDGNNNQTITDVFSFSVTNAAQSDAYMVLENMDKFLAPDILTFSRIEIPWRRQNDDGTYTPYNTNHDKVRLRIHNKGTGILIINNLALTNTTAWKITMLNGGNYNTSALPLSISSRASAELVIEFIAPDQGTRVSVLQGALNISSNDDLAPFKSVKLIGLWQKKGEGSSEPWAKEIINAYGLKTNVGFNANDGSTNRGTKIVANSDEIISPYFVRADPSKPVYVIQIAAYHGCCSQSETIKWHNKGSGTNTSIFTHIGLDGQTLLPRKGNTNPVPADGSFAPSGAFGLSIQQSFTDRARNFEGKIGIRIWKAKDVNGNIIPNAYLMGMDYLTSPFVNYDYQDNIYYVSNLRPEGGAVHYSELDATPSAVEFGAVLAGSSKNLSVNLKNLGRTYADGSSDPSITITSVELIGPNSSEFSATMPSTTTLGPQSSANTSVSFRPTSLGIKNAALLVHYSSAASPLRVPLYGIANNGSSTISIVKRVKGAADAGITIAGKAWEADMSYRSGSIKLDKQVVAGPIAATDEDVLYQSYLSASTDLAETRYAIPVPNGNYMVRMHFVENFFSATGARVFDITMENTKKLTALDIYSEVGYRTALVKDFDISVSDGTLNIKFNPTANRLAIAGLEIFRATSGIVSPSSSTESLQIAPEGLKLQVYPNPNSGDRMQMALEGFGQQEKVDIKIYDVTGRAVESLEVIVDELGTASTDIAVSKRLSRGLYIIKAQAASGEVRTRLLIE
ncbi:malectin domain-containing carbohydrate-binding protein [Pontibacter beigongshangensis]|uniref:malectin domain-containing carbohydrate-binding protein n=1 Tax=Pontibacter beigongshangensis TaxID=2574733 RepID=UPI00164F51E9|nr:malectin domain-containing carbohydrate-binding protein [Pontibacter beigongshangensis]